MHWDPTIHLGDLLVLGGGALGAFLAYMKFYREWTMHQFKVDLMYEHFERTVLVRKRPPLVMGD